MYPLLRWGSWRPRSQSSSASSKSETRAGSLAASAHSPGGQVLGQARADRAAVPPQGTVSSWWQCTSWATRWGWSTPATPPPSWRHSTSGWTLTTSSCPRTTSGASSSSTVSERQGHAGGLCTPTLNPAPPGAGATAVPLYRRETEARRGLVTCPYHSDGARNQTQNLHPEPNSGSCWSLWGGRGECPISDPLSS